MLIVTRHTYHTNFQDMTQEAPMVVPPHAPPTPLAPLFVAHTKAHLVAQVMA
jgi:hypothetical protein